MRNIVAVFVLFIAQLAFAQVSCDSTWVEYTNPTFGISIRKPLNWIVYESNSPITNIKFSSTDEAHYSNLILTYQDITSWNMDLGLYVKEGIDEIQNNCSTYKVEAIKDTLIDSCTAKIVTYTKSVKSLYMRFLQCYVLKQNKAFVLTFVTGVDEYKENAIYFSHFINSFRITQDSFLTINNKWQGIKIRCPFTWTVDEIDEQNILRISAPYNKENDTFNENIAFAVQELGDQKITLKEYSKLSIGALKKQIKTFVLISKSDTTISGYPANVIVFKDYSNGSNMKNMQVGIIAKGKIICVTFVAEEKDYDKYITTVKGIFCSLQL
jgi:hypothetical protein